MMSVDGMVGDQLVQDMMNRSTTSMADEGSLLFCNLPARQSVSEWEPSRMSYYNANEHLSVPFKWEAAPGKPIVDESSQPDRSDSSLQLRPPPSASNSPLNPLVPPSYKDQQKSRLPPKFRSYSRPEFTFSTSSKSSGSTTATDSSTGHQRARSKGSMSRRSEFDWPEVSDDEYSTHRTTDDQEPPALTATTTGKQWSFSSSSFSSTSRSSQSPSPVNSGVGSRGGGSTRDLFLLRNLVTIVAASAAAPTNCYVPGGGRSSTDGSEDGESEETDDHVRPGGFLSCMPIFSKVRMIQPTLSTSNKQIPTMINFSKRLTPGSKNRGYRQSL